MLLCANHSQRTMPLQNPQPKRSQSKQLQANSIRSRDWPIEQLPGLGKAEQQLLKDCGIQTTMQLLSQTQGKQQRVAIAARLRLHPQHVTKWIALANLARIPAVGCDRCGLLLHAGIASPQQLAQMPLHRLHRQIVKLHVAMLYQKDDCPTLAEVSEWLRQARLLSLGR